jgi:type IV secretory pathway VirB10-like protein
VATNLTQPVIPTVKRHNTVPLFIAGFVVFIMVVAYIIVLAHHAKKDVLAAYHQEYTTSKPIYDVNENVTLPAKQVEAPATPPASPPPPATPDKKDEDPWTKMARDNALKWAQMRWDHLFKATEASFDRSQKLSEKRFSEKQEALRASAAVDINGAGKDKASAQPPLLASLFTPRPAAPLEPTATSTPAAPMAQPPLVQQAGLRQASAITTAALVPPVSPYLLRQGTHIPVSLDQWLTSDAQGAWTARVTADVYDSINSQYLLIPAGSTLFGFSEVEEQNNQQPTLLLAARTLQLPNGASLDLGRTFAQNGQGIQGLSDEVNRHLWQRYGSAVVLSLVTAGIRMAAYQTGSYDHGFYLSPADAAAQGAGDVLGRAAGEELRRTMSIRPTVTVPLGYNFTVTLTQDITSLTPYQQQEDMQ